MIDILDADVGKSNSPAVDSAEAGTPSARRAETVHPLSTAEAEPDPFVRGQSHVIACRAPLGLRPIARSVPKSVPNYDESGARRCRRWQGVGRVAAHQQLRFAELAPEFGGGDPEMAGKITLHAWYCPITGYRLDLELARAQELPLTDMVLFG